MTFPKTKKIFIVLLIFSFFFNFLPSLAESNFKSPVLNPTNLSFNGPINAIAVDEMTGIVYVGGNFTKVGEIERNHLAAIGTDGTLLAWNPNANDTVSALAIKDSTIYVGGNFNSIGGTTRNDLAAIGTDGTLQGWNPDVSATNCMLACTAGVGALAINGSTIYVGGYFNSIGGTTRNNLAAIDTNGTLTSWNPDVNDAVYSLAINGSTIYVGGIFTLIGETKRNFLAAIGTDGILQNWNPEVAPQSKSDRSTVTALAIKDSTIYVGGSFLAIGRKRRNHLAAIGTDGALKRWNPNVSSSSSFSPSVYVIVISSSTVYVGGYFNKIGRRKRNNLAAIGTDGILQSWNPNVNLSVNTLAVSDATIYAGGDFTSIDNEPRANFASFSIPAP